MPLVRACLVLVWMLHFIFSWVFNISFDIFLDCEPVGLGAPPPLCQAQGAQIEDPFIITNDKV